MCILKKNVNADNIYQNHQAYSVGFYVKCNYDNSKSKLSLHRGRICIQWFIEELRNLYEFVLSELLQNQPMKFTPDMWAAFRTTTECHISKQPFNDITKKHCDRCHFTGKNRGVAHDYCNINYKESYVIPVEFHDSSGYDSHFFIKKLATQFDGVYLSRKKWIKL